VAAQSAWRKLHVKWMVDAQQAEMEMEMDNESGSTDVVEPPAVPGALKWLPCTLERLFGGEIANPLRRAP
jgi:hypothetical protein